jgi:hypothetical protein
LRFPAENPPYNFTLNKKLFTHMLRDKILAQLGAKFPGVSKKALGLIADKLAKKVTAEDGIDQAITDFDNAVSITEFANDLQREGDTRVGEAKKEWEKKNPPKPTDPPKPDQPPTDPPPNDPNAVPAWAKQLIDQVGTLTKEKTLGTIQSKAKELLKEVPEAFWNGRALPEKEEDLQTFVETVNKDFNALKQTFVNDGLMSATPPAGGGGTGSGDGKINEKVIDADIKAWADQGKPADAKK